MWNLFQKTSRYGTSNVRRATGDWGDWESGQRCYQIKYKKNKKDKKEKMSKLQHIFEVERFDESIERLFKRPIG